MKREEGADLKEYEPGVLEAVKDGLQDELVVGCDAVVCYLLMRQPYFWSDQLLMVQVRYLAQMEKRSGLKMKLHCLYQHVCSLIHCRAGHHLRCTVVLHKAVLAECDGSNGDAHASQMMHASSKSLHLISLLQRCISLKLESCNAASQKLSQSIWAQLLTPNSSSLAPVP